MKSTIRRSLLVAVFGLMITALSGFHNGNRTTVKAFAATSESCDRCIEAVQNSREVCNFLIKKCGVDWFIDPCEFSPGALCACATGCDPNASASASEIAK